MFIPTYTQKNRWTVAELKKKQNLFSRWFSFRQANGQYFAYITKNDADVPRNETLVGSATSLKELKRGIKKWYDSI